MKLNENILSLRKKNNVSRQTLSNWELGETTPNPELHISVDDLLGNRNNFKIKEKHRINHLYCWTMLVCGVLAALYDNCANRYRYDEILLIILGGIAAGYCVRLIINGAILKLKEKQNEN